VSDNIIDTSKPSAGRIYDYLLGGSHNFEVDRLAGDQITALLPFAPKISRLQRWALHDVAIELTRNQGFDIIFDFASGLPTQDHIHMNVPKGTTVIYSDFDPVVVESSRVILKDTPDVFFFENDAGRPEELLTRPEVQNILAGRRKVAFGFWGVTTFLTDEEINHAMQALYEWAAPGSCLAFNAQGVANQDNPAMRDALAIYASMGAPIHLRSLEQFQKLTQPWKMDAKGFVSFLEWHGFNQSELSNEDVDSFGPFGSGHGAYLTK
jgi:hypothetical protein